MKILRTLLGNIHQAFGASGTVASSAANITSGNISHKGVLIKALTQSVYNLLGFVADLLPYSGEKPAYICIPKYDVGDTVYGFDTEFHIVPLKIKAINFSITGDETATYYLVDGDWYQEEPHWDSGYWQSIFESEEEAQKFVEIFYKEV